jgi:hypothetical protein
LKKRGEENRSKIEEYMNSKSRQQKELENSKKLRE